MSTLQLGVLVSGSGTNLQAVLDAIQSGQLDAEVRVVISNRPGVRALDRARQAGVPALCLEHHGYPRREDYDATLVETLHAHGVQWVLLAGFLRVVTDVFVSAFPSRILNIHPSLLPAFPGLHAQGQALRYGVKVAGCTVHFVDGGVDTGPIIAQSTVPVLDGDDEDALSARILEQEHRLLVRVLQAVASGEVRIEGPLAEGGRPRVRARLR